MTRDRKKEGVELVRKRGEKGKETSEGEGAGEGGREKRTGFDEEVSSEPSEEGCVGELEDYQ